MPFVVEFTQSALDDLAVLEKRAQTRILDGIAIQLPHQPKIVKIKAVGYKEHNKLYIRLKEYKL